MKLYLDQMIRTEVGGELSKSGFNVLRAKDIGQARADDKEILDVAISQDRILVTLDEHFGNWTVLPLSCHPGVIRLKVHPTTSDKILALLLPFLRKGHHRPFQNHLIILAVCRTLLRPSANISRIESKTFLLF